MLSKFDDYPIHQTPEPLAHPAASDRNVYDRYWMNGFDRDGELYFAAGMAVYPHRGILDGAFSFVHEGRQVAFHASRRAPRERGCTQVGPLAIEVVEPMRRIRVHLADNDTGITCDLSFTARTAALEEKRQTLRRDARVVMDATRFAQFGRWQGEICYDGTRIEVDAERILGTKDRSWGIRPVGEPESGGAPSTTLPQFFFLWAPLHFDDRCTHFGVFEDEHGNAWHSEGAILPAYASPTEIPDVEDAAVEHMHSVAHRLRYAPGTRRADAAELAMLAPSGERHVIALEPVLCFRMKGLGYLHPEWGQGVWKGELALAGESWEVEEVDPLAFENLHIQQVVRAHMGDHVGVGVLEQLCIGPHAPSGFTQFMDGAP